MDGENQENKTCFQSDNDAIVLLDKLTCFWDRAVFDKESPMELPTIVGSGRITREEQEQTGLDWESDGERLEETPLKCLLDSLSRDLEDLKKELSRLRDLELETESAIVNMQSRLRGKGEPDQEEDLESLHQRIKENGALTEKKVADATIELEKLRRSEREALTKLEIARRELEEVRSEKEVALKRSKLAEMAKAAMEEELRRCFLKAREIPVLVHASAWAAETENVRGNHHRWPRGGRGMPSTLDSETEEGQR